MAVTTAPEPTKVCGRADCPHGGAPQPLANFYRDRSRADGLRYVCKTCTTRDATAWRAAHPERARERNTVFCRHWRERHAEQYREWQREYRRQSRAKKRAEMEKTA